MLGCKVLRFKVVGAMVQNIKVPGLRFRMLSC